MLRLGETSAPLTVDLNDYLPALAPGHYRTRLVIRKLVLASRGPMSTTYGYPNPPETTTSNAVEFDIVPASQNWLDQTVAARVRQAYRGGAAATVPRHPGSRRASLTLMPLEEYTLRRGLAADAGRGAGAIAVRFELFLVRDVSGLR